MPSLVVTPVVVTPVSVSLVRVSLVRASLVNVVMRILRGAGVPCRPPAPDVRVCRGRPGGRASVGGAAEEPAGASMPAFGQLRGSDPSLVVPDQPAGLGGSDPQDGVRVVCVQHGDLQ